MFRLASRKKRKKKRGKRKEIDAYEATKGKGVLCAIGTMEKS